MAYSSDDLLSIIKKRAFLPVSQETFTDQDILDMATDEMYSQVVPDVLSTREEWYVTPQSVAITSSTTSVDIPSRAIGGSLREVQYDRGGSQLWDLPRLDLEDKTYTDASAGSIRGFYISGNQVQLLGNCDGNLILYYHARPGRLIPTADVPKVQSVNLTTNTITLDIASPWNIGDVVDVIKSKPHFEYRNLSLTITNVAGTVITVAEALSDKIEVNDWVSSEDTSPAPQIPVEWFPFLAEAVAVQIFLSQGDAEAAQAAESKMNKLKNSALKLMTPRVEGEPRRLVPPKNRGSYTWR